MDIRDIPGYEGLYQVTSDGKVISLNYRNRGLVAELKITKSKDGYLGMILRSECGKTAYKRLHRVMAQVFIPNPENKPVVNHKDGDKANRDLSNLEWATSRDNNIHARDNGLTPISCKINMDIANEIRALYSTKIYTQNQISKMFNIGQDSISLIVNYKRWQDTNLIERGCSSVNC